MPVIFCTFAVEKIICYMKKSFFQSLHVMFMLLCLPVCGLAQDLVSEQPNSPILIKQGNMFYHGEQAMNRAAYKQFLQSECPQAYQQYKQGQQCMIAGWVLLGAGLIGGAYTGPAWFVSGFGSSSTPPNVDNSARHANRAFLGGLCASAAVVIASIPLLSVGYIKMDNTSVKTYNEQCSKQNVELAFGISGNSVGIVMRF